MAISLFCRVVVTLALLSSIFLFIPGVADVYSLRRIIQLFIIGLLVSSLAFNRSVFTDYGRELGLILLAAGLALLSSTLYSSSEFYLAEVFFLPFWLLAVLVLAAWMRQVAFARMLKYVLITLVLLECLYVLTTLVFYQQLMRAGTDGLAEQIPWGYANIRYWSHTATWLLPLMPLALRLKVSALESFWRPLVFLVASTMVWIILLSTARGSVLSLVVATLVVGFLVGRGVLNWLQDMTRFLLAGAGLWLLLSWLTPMLMLDADVSHKTLHFTSAGRMPMWLEAWVMSWENFPLGMGAQSWLTHEVITPEYAATSIRFGHPHNMYLQWAAEYGWVYVMVLALFWFSALDLGHLYKHVRLVQHTDSAVVEARVALLISFLAACVHACLSAVFWAPASMLLGLVICALLLASVPGRKRQSVGPLSRSPWLQRIIGMMVLLVLLFWLFEVAEYHQAMQLEYGEVDYDDWRGPRFWLLSDLPR